MKKVVLIILVVLVSSCRQHQSFNKALWVEDDGESKQGNRELMIDDLVENYQIKGLKYKQIIDLLGKPANWGGEKDIVGFQISADYGHDIDPVYSKSLIIKLDKDSVATSFQVKEWKKN